MKRPNDFPINSRGLAATVLLVAWAIVLRCPAGPKPQRRHRRRGTHHHVIFSNPADLQEAMMNGRREEWEHICTDLVY